MTGRLLRLTILVSLLAAASRAGAQAPPPPALPTEIEGYRLLYVPAERFDAVLQRDGRGVFLPQDEFRKLVQEARANVEKLGSRPAAVVISSVGYTARIDGEQFLISATARVENTIPGWADLAFPVEGLSVEELKIDDRPAAVNRDPANANQLHVFLEKPGAHVLTATFSAPLVAVGSDQTVGFSLLPSAAAEMKVSLPAKSFLLVDGLQLKRPAANDAPAEYVVALGGKPKVQLQITGRQASERADVLTLANTAFGVRVTPGDVAWSARTQLQVFGRAVDKLVCRVPRLLEITSVESIGLESWELADTENDMTSTTLTLNYRQPVEGSRAIDFRGVVRVAPGQTWDVPQLQIDGVASHVGVVRVEFPPGVRVRPDKSTGVRQVTEAEMAGTGAPAVAVAGDQSLVFQVWKPDFKLSFTTESKAREVQAAVTTLVDINDQALELTALATIETRFAPLFDALVSIPAGWQILGTQVDGHAVDHQVLPNEAGTQLIRIILQPPLPPGKSRSIQVSARLIPEKWPLEEARQRLPLPDVRYPQASLVEGLYGITSSNGLEVVPLELQGLDTARVADMNLLRQKLGPQAPNLRHGFTYQEATFAGQVDASRKPARMAVATRSFFRVDPDSLFTRIEADLSIEGGGLRKLTLMLPEAAGTDLRFRLLCSPSNVAAAQAASGTLQTVQIIEQTSLPPVDGVRTWILRFDRFVTGPHLLAVDVRMPRTGEVFTAPQLRVAGAERENGYIAIEAEEDQFLVPQAVDASGRPLPVVDPVDVPAGLYRPAKRIVAAYFADRGGWQVGVKEQRFPRTSVPTAIVHSAALSTVLSENGEWQHQAEVLYSAVGVQAFRMELPDAELWAAMIDERPVEVRRQGDSYLIPLPAAKDDAKHMLRVLYRSLSDPVVDTSSGRLKQSPPVLRVVDGAGGEQPLEVLAQTWTLYYPSELVLTGSDGTFRPKSRLWSGGVIDTAWRLLTSPRPRDLGRAALVAIVIFGIAWLIRIALLRVRDTEINWGRVAIAAGCLVILGMCGLFLLPRQARERMATATKSAVDFTDGTDHSFRAPGSQVDLTAISGEAVVVDSSKSMNAPTAPVSGPVPVGAAPKSAFPSYADYDNFAPSPVPPPAPAAEPQTPAKENLGRFEKAGKSSLEDATIPQAATPVARSRGVEEVDESRPRNGQPNRMRKDSAGVAAGSGGFDTKAGVSAGQVQPGQADGAPDRAPAPSGPLGEAKGVVLSTDEEKGSALTGRLPSRSGFSLDAGLLSLHTALHVPSDSRQETFEHRGEDGIAAPPPSNVPSLDIGYRRVGSANFRMWVVAAAVLLAAWLLRRQSVVVAVLILLALIAPLAAAPLLPASLQDLLDGLFFGGVGGAILLAVIESLRRVSTCLGFRCCPPSGTRTAALLLLAAIGMSGESCRADEVADAIRDPHALVVPYGGDDPLTAFRVFLPQETYLKLYSEAHPEEATPAPAPVDAAVAEALYSGSLVEEAGTQTARVKARFLVESFRKTQVRLALPVGALALKSATLDGQSAPILVENDRPVLLLDRPGRRVLDLEFEVPVNSTGPAGRLTLSLHPTSAARLRFEFPTPDLEVRLNGATGLFRRVTAEGKTAIEAPVDRGGQVALSWQPKQMKGIDTALVQVETSVVASFDDSGLLVGNGFLVRVRQGAIPELKLALPEGFSVRQISGADVGGWQLEAGGAGVLKVFFRRPIDSETRLRIDLFRPLPGGDAPAEIVLPELVPQDVSREIGQVAVFASDQFGLRVGDVNGAVQIDAEKFAPTSEVTRPQTPPRLAYRFSARPVKLAVTPFRRQPETVVAAEHGVLVGLRKVLVASLFHYQFADAPRASVSFELPPGYLPINVGAGDVLSDWYVSPIGEGGTQVLTVEFTGPVSGSALVSLQGRVSRQPDIATAPVQAPRPLELTRATTTLGVWFDDVYAASLREIPTVWKPLPVDRASLRLRGLQPRPLQFAFQSTALELPAIPFDLIRNVAQLSGDSITLVAVSSTSVDYGLTLRWKIARAAAETFQFVTPLWLEGRLQFHDPQIRQVTSNRVDNVIRWTVTLNEPVRQQLLLSAVATLPPAADEIVQFPEIQMEQPGVAAVVTPLETQRHFGVLVNLSSRQLAPVNPSGVRSVTRQNLPFVIQDALLEQAMEVVELPAGEPGPKWKSQRAEEVQGTLASVTGAEVVTVFDPDGSWRTRAEYTIRSRGQQFLGLRLPAASRVLGAIVGDRPSRTVATTLGTDEVHLIPLPETNISDLSLRVSLIIAGATGGRLSDLLSPRAQSFDIPAPQVVTRAESAEFGMTVAQTLWTVYVPDDFTVTPIIDAKRTNVMPEEEEDFAVSSELLAAQRQVADVLDLLKVQSSEKYSGSQRTIANSNLKQLGVALQYYESGAERFRGKNRARYIDFVDNNRALFEQAQQAAQAGTAQPPAESAGSNSQSFILGNTLQLNAFNGGQALEGIESAPAATAPPADAPEAAFEFRIESESGNKKADQKLESSRSKLRGQIANQSGIDFSYQQPAAPQIAAPQGEGFGGRGMSPSGGALFGNSAGGLGSGVMSTPGQRQGAAEYARKGESEITSDDREVQTSVPGERSSWSSAGGLSLRFDLPHTGRALHFSKVGGGPKLALAVRPGQTWDTISGWIWGAVWIAFGCWLVSLVRRPEARGRVMSLAPLALALVGAGCYLLLPGDGRIIGLLIWIVVAVWIALSGLRNTATR